MIGIGPITMRSVTDRMSEGMTFEAAKVTELKQFLTDNLSYIDSEIKELSIEETKFAAKGESVLYIALSKPEQVHEMHVRRAECRNDKLTIRNYIPPNFFERFMSMNRACADSENMNLE